MSKKFFRSLALLVTFGALFAASGLFIARANAAPDITPYSRDWADHGGAKAICGAFDKFGMTEENVSTVVSTVEELAAVSQYEAAGILVYSVHDYCPSYWVTLGKIVGATPEESVRAYTQGTLV